MNWYRVTKTIRGRKYDYWQKTYRVGRSTKTLNKYIGPAGANGGGASPGIRTAPKNIAWRGDKEFTVHYNTHYKQFYVVMGEQAYSYYEQEKAAKFNETCTRKLMDGEKFDIEKLYHSIKKEEEEQIRNKTAEIKIAPKTALVRRLKPITRAALRNAAMQRELSQAASNLNQQITETRKAAKEAGRFGFNQRHELEALKETRRFYRQTHKRLYRKNLKATRRKKG